MHPLAPARPNRLRLHPAASAVLRFLSVVVLLPSGGLLSLDGAAPGGTGNARVSAPPAPEAGRGPREAEAGRGAVEEKSARAAGEEERGEKREKEQAGRSAEEGGGGKDAKAKREGKKRPPPIPEIPRDKLPPQTRPRPDPAKVQYVREPVYVRIEETIAPAEGDAYRPDPPLTEAYLSEYFRRAGHRVVEKPAEAAYRIEGKVEVVFDETLTFKGDTIGWKVVASAYVAVRDREGRVLEEHTLPRVEHTNASSEKSAYRQIRRLVAKRLHDLLFVEGKVFTESEVVRLLSLLTTDPLELDNPLTAEEIVGKLADLGFRAVPYLLEALSDTRTVLADSDYPGLVNPEDLKVYHIADKALEEIFQKVSRMGLRTPDHHRFIIIRGWSNEWRRFCPAYRESPLAPAKRAAGAPRKTGDGKEGQAEQRKENRRR